MMKRHLVHGLCAALMLTWSAAICLGGEPSERRMTPLVKAVQQVRMSVVNIHSEKTTQETSTLFPNGKSRKVNGMGTGIIVDERGYIVTNHHVIKGVDTLRVTLFDGSTFDAHVISFDQKHDLAIIKIHSSKSLPVMTMGTSSDLLLGESVIAIGNAYGYEHTVTAGIISALSRDVEVNEFQSYENLIQTDASINPGNSGGPLLNMDGEVIGINVAIRAGAQRIGFAIPIDDAREVIAQLLSVERLDATWHGLQTRDIKTADERKLVVTGVEPNSPAAAAGLQAGDIIGKVGEITVIDRVDLERALLGKHANQPLEIQVHRENQDQQLSLAVTVLPANRMGVRNQENVVVRANNETINDKAWMMLGMKLAPMTLTPAQANGTTYRGGMMVSAVRTGSPAEKNGIRQGDVLVGLHLWETVSQENITYVLDHPQFTTFNPLKFYILRGRETLYGYLQVPGAAPTSTAQAQ